MHLEKAAYPHSEHRDGLMLEMSKNNAMGSLQRLKILKNLVGRQEGLMRYDTYQLVPLVRVPVLASLARLLLPGFLLLSCIALNPMILAT